MWVINQQYLATPLSYSTFQERRPVVLRPYLSIGLPFDIFKYLLSYYLQILLNLGNSLFGHIPCIETFDISRLDGFHS